MRTFGLDVIYPLPDTHTYTHVSHCCGEFIIYIIQLALIILGDGLGVLFNVHQLPALFHHLAVCASALISSAHAGARRSIVVACDPLKMCSRSAPAAPWGCGTIVARVKAPASVADSAVGLASSADTPRNFTGVSFVLVGCTVMSYTILLPLVFGRVEMWTEMAVPVSVSRAMVRVWTSPPNRRAVRRTHGVAWGVVGGWSRRAKKRAAWAKSSAGGSARGGSSLSWCLWGGVYQNNSHHNCKGEKDNTGIKPVSTSAAMKAG